MAGNDYGWYAKGEARFSQGRGYRRRGGSRGRGYGRRGRDDPHGYEGPSSHNRHMEDRNWNTASKEGNRGKQSARANRRGRHPPELKGREIGLWYAQRSTATTKLMSKAPVLSMDEQEAHAINRAIDGLSSNSQTTVKSPPLGALSKPPSTSPEFDLRRTLEEKRCEKPVQPTIPAVDSFDNPDVFIATNAKKQRKGADVSGLLDHIQESDFKSAYRANIEGNKLRDLQGLKSTEKELSKLSRKPQLDERLLAELRRKEQNPQYQQMLKFRQRLPSFEMKDQILSLIRSNQVVVLSGETGCGKTTQVAQFVLDDAIQRGQGSTCRVVCTQPRRISAITVAERVAVERAEPLGTSVGYQIRLEARRSRAQGSILYCTTGIVLQWLQSDPLLSSVSHLVLDEIHERDATSDFLICIAKDIIRLRPDLKVILMSATLNAEHFSKYYGGCPMVHIPGFTYTVTEYYLEDVLNFTGFRFDDRSQRQARSWRRFNEEREQKQFEDFILPHLRKLEETEEYPQSVLQELWKRSSEELNLDLVLDLLKYIATQPPGAVLVFVPGWEQISKLHKMISGDRFFKSTDFLVIPLHSLMPTVNQREVFNRPPQGVRKIVIATNIAETSITIDDIVYVIDGGRIKMKNYDKESNISTLLPEWVTMANAHQRRGRAGRVQEGICYHLFTKAREMLLDSFPLPEIQRTRLEEVILQVKILRLGSCRSFLSKILDPPEEGVIDVSIKMLLAISALDAEENLTPLGFHLARLPMDPLTGKMILMAAIFSCVSPILTVAASLSFKDPFIMVLGKEKLVDKCRQRHANDTKSDHLMMANVFHEWQQRGGRSGAQGANSFVWDNFLSSSILTQLKNMRYQFMDILNEQKFVSSRDPEDEDLNRNSKNLSLVKAIITAGLYPNVARILKNPRGKMKGKFKRLVIPDLKKGVAIHPKSVNEPEKWFENSWLVYWEKIKTSKVYLYDSTMISNYPLLLFGQKLEYDAKEKVISVDAFVKVRSDKNVADVIQKLRRELDELLEYKISHPGVTDWSEGSKEGKLLSLIVEILTNEKDTDDAEQYQNYANDEDEDDY